MDGIPDGDVVKERYERMLQGGRPPSLRAVVLLDEEDKEQERLGHFLVLYADDGSVYVGNCQAGGWLLKALRRRYDRYHLKVRPVVCIIGQDCCLTWQLSHSFKEASSLKSSTKTNLCSGVRLVLIALFPARFLIDTARWLYGTCNANHEKVEVKNRVAEQLLNVI